MSNYREEMYSVRESLPDEDYVIATYLISANTKDCFQFAGELAAEQSTGSWIRLPLETVDMMNRHGGKAIHYFEVPDYEYENPGGKRTFVLEVAFPTENFGSQVPMLLTSVVGVISMMGDLKLVDLTFPKKYLAGFPGPKFGMEGIRNYLNVYDRPLIGSVVKPCTGLTPQQTSDYFYEVAAGGVDLVKDDEKNANTAYSTIAERVSLCMRAEKRAYEETGKRTLYAVNITDTPKRMFDHAKAAIDAGANMLMVCHIPAGFGVLQDLAESNDIQVPIMVHPDLAGSISWSSTSGISSNLMLGKLPRLCGADISDFPSCYGRMPILKEKYMQIAYTLRVPISGIRSTFPMTGGAMHPGMVKLVINDLGNDVILGAGGSISAHPMGPNAGAKAMVQAVQAAINSQDLITQSAEHKELETAIKLWGIVGEEERTTQGIR
jgi:2,3-diketo-5-methylthiopentyl-1-phosphate enolase